MIHMHDIDGHTQEMEVIVKEVVKYRKGSSKERCNERNEGKLKEEPL